MARSFTRAELRSRLQKMCDIENDSHLSTTELNEILNSAMAETWDKIVGAGLGEKYVKKADFVTVAGQSEYDFSSICLDGDFYRVSQLYVVENTDQLRALQRVNPSEIQSFKPPQSSGVTLRLYYIPSAPVWNTAAGDDGSMTFDGINGWEEHLLVTAALTVKSKKEDGYRFFYERKQELEARIKEMGMVDFSEPIRISRKRRRHSDPWIAYNNNINAYVLRGDKVELYYLYGYSVA